MYLPFHNLTHQNCPDPKVEHEPVLGKMTELIIEEQWHPSMLSMDSSWVVQGFFVTVGLLAMAVYSQHKIPESVLGWVAAIGYIVFSISLDLILSKAKTGGVNPFNFEPGCVSVLVELGKLVVSLVLFGLSRLQPVLNGERLFQNHCSVKDAMWLSFPAILYLLSNLLAFRAIGENDVASYGVFRDTVLLWNAGMWTVVFQVSLNAKQVIALLGIFCGLVVNQIEPLLSATWTPSILLVCGMAFINALASVVQEFALKQKMHLDINLQNAISCIFGLAVALVYLMLKAPAKLASRQAFFDGFDMLTFLLVSQLLVLSLLVVRIIKYASSVVKSVMQCLRAPLIMLLAPTLGLESRTDAFAYISAATVSLSAFFFLLQGKPHVKLPRKPNAEVPREFSTEEQSATRSMGTK